jgi:signal transduction histidine kinase
MDHLAEVSIPDTGPRIVPDKVKQVFEPFFTSKAQGMGIGLSIARTIVEAQVVA